MKIIFLGNHSVGVESLTALLSINKVKVVGVVAHPPDPEDGVVYASVYKFAITKNLNVIRGRAKDKKTYDFIKNAKPDLIWVTDYRYLISMKIISEAVFGAVNLHPSLLPKYRGRASLNWAILNGEKEIGLTAHFIDKNLDSGDIINQKKFFLNENEDVGDALKKLMPYYSSITKDVINKFQNNTVTSVPQDHSLATIYPSRKPEDGVINWFNSAEQIFNFVRALSYPYPGAFSDIKKSRIYIWKAELIKDNNESKIAPGTILKYLKDKRFIIKCGFGKLKVTKWTIFPKKSFELKVKMRL